MTKQLDETLEFKEYSVDVARKFIEKLKEKLDDSIRAIVEYRKLINENAEIRGLPVKLGELRFSGKRCLGSCD